VKLIDKEDNLPIRGDYFVNNCFKAGGALWRGTFLWCRRLRYHPVPRRAAAPAMNASREGGSSCMWKVSTRLSEGLRGSLRHGTRPGWCAPGREGDLFSVDPGLVGCCGEEGGGIDLRMTRGVPDRAAPLGLRVPVQATAVWFTSARRG